MYYSLKIVVLALYIVKVKGSCKCSHENFDEEVSNGIFKSPMFPRNYCNDLDCVYEIEPKANHAVGLVVEYFDTEPSHDYVEICQIIFDPFGSRQYIKQHILSGQSITHRHFYSAIAGGLRVNFVTDASESGFSGFQMSFYRFEEDSQRNFPCPQPLHFAVSESVPLPELASDFRTDSLCAFLINSTEAVQITVRSLAASLTLKIYETENFNLRRTGEMLESLNGFALLNLPYSVTSRTSSLTLIVSFSPATHSIYQHSYDIEFKSTPSVCNCPPSKIQMDYGEVQHFISPGFPLEYCDLENCTTHVTIKPRSQSHNISVMPVIRAHLQSFHLETDVDYLEMVDQKTLIALTDNAKSITYFTFDHFQVSLRFVTDNSVTDKGFNLTLDVYQKPYYCECPGSPQVLQEDKYGQNYTFEEECRFLDCFWEIRRPISLHADEGLEKFRVVMKIIFQFNAPTEFIEVSNGQNLERNHDNLRLDTTMIADGKFAERSIEFEYPAFVSIWFHREGDVGGGLRFVDIEYEWREKCLCGTSQLEADADDWKQLTSPDYPTSYCNDLNCTYMVIAPLDHCILINVTDFFTEVNQDFLMIFDGNSTAERHLEALSGMELFTNLIRSKGNVMTLLFTSDNSLSMRGFALWYKAERTFVEPLSEPAESSSHRQGGLFTIAHVVIFLLLIVIAALLIHVAKLHYPTKFNSDTVVRFTRLISY